MKMPSPLFYLIPLRLLCLISCILLISSCQFHRLTVQTQYLSPETRASYFIETPDPYLKNPRIGQRLLIQWCLSNHKICGKVVKLRLKMRLKNNQEVEKIFEISPQSGKFTRGYLTEDLVNTDYVESGGILTYRVDIFCEGDVIETWSHPLWTDLITFN